MRKRKYLLLFLLFFILGGLYFWRSLLISPGPESGPLQPEAGKIGQLEFKTNQVFRRQADRPVWEVLEVQQPVFVEDIIVTRGDSRARLQLDSGKKVTLEAGSVMQIQQTQAAGPAGLPLGEQTVSLHLSRGALAVSGNSREKTEVVTAAGEHLQVAPQGDAVISTVAGKATTVQVSQGEVELASPEQKQILAAGIYLLPQNPPLIPDKPAGTESGPALERISEAPAQGKNGNLQPELALPPDRQQPAQEIRHLKVIDTFEPANEQVYAGYKEKKIRFRWQKTNASRLFLAKDPLLQNVVFELGAEGEAEKNLSAGIWYWQVKNHDGSQVSPVQVIWIDNENAAVTLYPPDQTELLLEPSAFVFLQWRPFAAASGARLVISRQADLSEPVQNLLVSENSLSLSNLQPGRYYWSVQKDYGERKTELAGPVKISSFTLLHTAASGREPTAGLLVESGRQIDFSATAASRQNQSAGKDTLPADRPAEPGRASPAAAAGPSDFGSSPASRQNQSAGKDTLPADRPAEAGRASQSAAGQSEFVASAASRQNLAADKDTLPADRAAEPARVSQAAAAGPSDFGSSPASRQNLAADKDTLPADRPAEPGRASQAAAGERQQGQDSTAKPAAQPELPRYEVELRDSRNQTVMARKSQEGSITAIPADLAPGNYALSVRPLSQPGPVQNYQVVVPSARTLSAAVLLSPVQETALAAGENRVELQWRAVSGASRYELQIFQSPEGKPVFQTTLADTSFAWQVPENTRSFYWQVKPLAFDRENRLSGQGQAVMVEVSVRRLPPPEPPQVISVEVQPLEKNSR